MAHSGAVDVGRHRTHPIDPRPLARTLGGLLAEIAGRIPAAEALVAGSIRYTYSELQSEVDHVARGFLAAGIGKGDRVAILMGNRAEWTICWYALNVVGAVAVGVSTWSSDQELAYILRHADAKMLITVPTFRSRDFTRTVLLLLPELATCSPGTLRTPRFPFLNHVVMLGSAPAPGLMTFDALRQGGERISEEHVHAAADEVRPGDVALLPYTSGSTGTPKGVQLVHRDMIENGYDIGVAEEFHQGDRFWLVLPLFWSAGNANTSMVALTHGGTLVLQEYFEAGEALRLLEQERCTHYFAFPNVTAALYDHPDRPNRRLSSARVAISTGNREGIRMLREMGFKRFAQPYGTTEDYGFATINDLDDPIEVVYETQGRPLPGIIVKIMSPETGEELGPDQSGEIVLKGHVTIGYYKDEDKNREAFDEAGYFHTGDLGRIDADGRLRLEGRLRELIKTGGVNVSPVEVELVLMRHPDVAEAYVVGLPHPLKGQIVAAFVRAKSGQAAEEDLRSFCREQLSSYKVPELIRFRETFPMTDTGKVSKRLLEQESVDAP